MKLSKEEIKHIANLARLELSEEEVTIYDDQLSHILDYIDQLQEVNIKNIEPTAQVISKENIMREDDVKKWSDKEVDSALEQTPRMEKRQAKVKRVL